MFLRSLDGIVADKDALHREVKTADRIGRLYLGDKHLIHKGILTSSYISYTSIDRVFLRIDSGEYGDVQLDQYILVIEDKEGTERTIHVERRQVVDKVLEWFAQNHPEISTGKRYN